MPTFLTPLTRSDAASLVLRNERTGAAVADRLLPALDSETRRTGLLKHSSLPCGEAMVIAPTNAIHTFFMRFPIDAAFLTPGGEVIKAFHTLRPWRVTSIYPRAQSVLDLPAGTLDHTRTREGDVLVFDSSDRL